MREQHNSCRLIRRIFNYPSLNQPSRLSISVNNRRVSIDDPIAEKTNAKTITKTVNDIVNTANKNVIDEISRVNLMGVICRMRNILYIRLIVAIISI